MAIQVIQGGPTKLRTIKVRKHCLGPGGVVLTKGQTCKVPEPDAYTLVSGEQAEFVEDTVAKGDDK